MKKMQQTALCFVFWLLPIFCFASNDSEFIHLRFMINEKAVISRLLLSSPSSSNPRQTNLIYAFRHRIRTLCPNEYETLIYFRALTVIDQDYNGNVFTVFDPITSSLEKKQNPRYQKAIQEIVNTARKTKEYRVILSQTKQHLSLSRHEWEKNYTKAFSYMKELSGIHFHKTFTIYVVYPGTPIGRYLEKKRVLVGNGKFPELTVAILWHEILHSYLDFSMISHALIELSEEALYQKLRGTTSPAQGHPYLKPVKEKIQADWKTYLSSPKKNIFTLVKQLKKKYPEFARE